MSLNNLIVLNIIQWNNFGTCYSTPLRKICCGIFSKIVKTLICANIAKFFPTIWQEIFLDSSCGIFQIFQKFSVEYSLKFSNFSKYFKIFSVLLSHFFQVKFHSYGNFHSEIFID